MITTVTLNPALDREFFVEENKPGKHQYISQKENTQLSPGGKGLVSAIHLKHLGYSDVQNIGFVGGSQGLFFEKMVQDHKVTTNYIYTEQEIRSNFFIIGQKPVSYTHYNDYTYEVDPSYTEQLLKRFKRGITDSEIIMISGSIPKGINPDIYKQLTKICHDRGKEVYLHASGKELYQALPENPKFVAPYFRQNKELLDRELETRKDYIKAGRRLQDKGAQYIMIPFHCNHIILNPEGAAYSISAEDFCLRNWLGAREAYNAAFFDHIFREGYDFIETNKYAGAAALDIAEKKKVFLSQREEIEENLKKIAVEEIKVD